jgi:probable rRNA maturation factor
MEPRSSRPNPDPPVPGTPIPYPPNPGTIDLIVTEPAWRKLVPRVEAVVRRAAKAAGMQGTVVLATDRMVRRLNAMHRGKNKPTNVLTYEQPAPEAILALGVIRAEAAAQRRRPAHHLAHLVVHAALHLQGEDHHQPGEARRMEMAESRILRSIGVPNPWKRA